MDAFFAAPQTRNAAVKIVAPSSQHQDSRQQSNSSSSSFYSEKKSGAGAFSPKKDTTQRQCRNIMIHGFCKYEGKGCMYHHPPKEEPVPVPLPEQDTLEHNQVDFNDNGAGVGNTSLSFPLQAVNAPVFVPRTLTSPQRGERIATVYTPPPYSGADTSYDASENSPTNVVHAHGSTMMEGLSHQMDQLVFGDYDLHGLDEHMLAVAQHQQDYDTLPPVDPFYQPQPFIRHSLNYHLYTLPTPTTPGRKFFISDHIREDLLRKSEQVHTGPAAPGSLPEEVQGYHSLVPLEVDKKKVGSGGAGSGIGSGIGGGLGGGRTADGGGGMGGGWPSMSYKAIKSEDGGTYVLRRIENFRLMNEQAFSVIEKWTKIRHPGIVAIHEAFTTRAFGDNSLVVVYDYHPNALTLAELHFYQQGFRANGSSTSNSSGFSRGSQSYNQPGSGIGAGVGAGAGGGAAGRLERIPEQTLWSYIFQIASAMRAVHEAGFAVRMVDASKILWTGQNRVRISSCAVFDILLYETRQEPLLLQQEDMIMFAKLIMSLACSNPSAVRDVHKSLDHVHRFYPGNIKDVIHYLMKTPGPMKNIHGLFETFGGKLVLELDAAHGTIDKLEGELMGELENARLVRLLCKFGFINERPEFDRDPRWSETGDRYIIKLFRDYVFHSVDENGNPVVNLAHVLTNLNKLDVGSEERLMLVSRDEQSCLVVTYREIKKCIDDAFGDLTRNR